MNSGACNSADRNYLAAAERTGQVTVAPLHRMTGLSSDSAGRYRVCAERIDENGTVLEQVILVADARAKPRWAPLSSCGMAHPHQLNGDLPGSGYRKS
ncbi:MAG: hypothetical protein ACRDSI_13705 [Pseudonocardiaceae bacterium]